MWAFLKQYVVSALCHNSSKRRIMQKDTQMDIIADYYMALGKYSPNEKYSESNSRVYTSPENDCWLVLERKGDQL